MSAEQKPGYELSTGDSLSLITLLVVLLDMAIPSLPLWFRVLLLLPIILVVRWFAMKSVWIRKWSRIQRIALSLVLFTVIASLAIAQWRNEHPTVVLEYGSKPLDKQTVTLVNPCPKVQIQLQASMCIDSNYPNNFNLFAIKMVSDTPVQLHEARLEFSPGLLPMPTISGAWQQLNQEGTEYGYEYELTIPVILPANQPLDLPPFLLGTPLPSPETRITVRVTYGDSLTTKATFTLKRPETAPSP